MNSDTTPSLAMQLGSTALALVLVLALAWVMLRALKRWQLKTGLGMGAAGDPVQVLHTVALSPRERLVTVRWRGHDYLLGVTAGAVNRIANAPAPALASTALPAHDTAASAPPARSP
jgi:flagellar protein FliO/FliZ